MNRIFALALLTALGWACAATADDDDKIQGNYQGAFTGGAGSRTLRAEVIGEPRGRVRACLFIGENGVEKETIVWGHRALRGGHADFEHEIDSASGTVKASGTIDNEVFKGQLGSADSAFELKRVIVKPESLGAKPPEGALVLFDGTNTNEWDRSPLGWCIQGDGSMEICSSNLVTKKEFGDAQFHCEFMTPYMPNEKEQARGNSGFYVQGRYEVQVLDSFGDPAKWDHCGGIYKVAEPKLNASLPPMTWQTYDVTFHAAKFDASGNKTKNAVITVVHNGKTIHENLELPSPTPGGVGDKDAPKGPLMLQDHHNNVRYKNIWVKPLD